MFENKNKIKWILSFLIIMLIIMIMSFISQISNFSNLQKEIQQLNKTNAHLIVILEEIQQEIQFKEEAETILYEPAYNFTEEEVVLLAQLLCGDPSKDGDGEYDFEHQKIINDYEVRKVLEVVMNRVQTPGIYASDIATVLLQPGAFSVFPKNLSAYPSNEVLSYISNWCCEYNSPDYISTIPEDHYWFSESRGSNITRGKF